MKQGTEVSCFSLSLLRDSFLRTGFVVHHRCMCCKFSISKEHQSYMNNFDSHTLIEEETAIETKPEISEETRKKLSAQVVAVGQVIVHCKLSSSSEGNVARISPSTYLIDRKSNNRSRLIYVEGITIFPFWTEVPTSATLYFTLVLSPLLKSCLIFDFLEQISESGGFHVADILRNSTDVYHIDLSDDAF